MHDEFGSGWQQLAAESTLWAMSRTHLAALAEALSRNQPTAQRNRRDAMPGAASRTAVIPVIGPLVRRRSFLSEFLNLGTYAGIRAALDQAVGDKSVEHIILFVDSPGGSAGGTEEVAADVARAARAKPVTAYVDGLAASAAYWIATAAGEVISTPSGEVGSIGVFALHTDFSRALDSAGIVPTFIVSHQSPRKVEGNSLEPLADGARERWQADVNALASKFVNDVARGRKVSPTVVTSRFGRGSTLFAEAAKAVKMIDRIGSFADAAGGSATTALSRRADRGVTARARRLAILRA